MSRLIAVCLALVLCGSASATDYIQVVHVRRVVVAPVVYAPVVQHVQAVQVVDTYPVHFQSVQRVVAPRVVIQRNVVVQRNVFVRPVVQRQVIRQVVSR